jgi:hypothetical protein
MNEELILNEIKDIKEDIRAIKECLFMGNGKPSICTRLAQVETVTKTLTRSLWLVIGGVVTITTSWFALNILHIKLPG